MTQIITNNGGGGGVGLYKYKGSVDYYEDLPSSGMKVGDTYNVVNAFTKDGKDYPAGTNVAWTGTDWDALGGSIDLSDYQKKLVEGEGIDLDQDTNEISVESTVIDGAALGATSVQPGDNVSTLTNDAGYIDNTVDDLTNYTKTSDLAAVALSNDYDDLSNKPTIGDAEILLQKNGVNIGGFGVNDTSNTTVNITMDKSDVGLGNVDNTSDLNKPISTATQSALDLKANSADLATVATTGDYDDLIDKPTIGNATLTIQRNGTNVNTFTANATSNVTANISVPTKTSDITNDSGFITKDVNNLTNYTLTTSLASVATSGSYNDLSNKPTIPSKTSDLTNDSGFIDNTVNDLTNYTLSSDLASVATSGSYNDLSNKPTIGDATIKIQKNSTDIDSFTTNATSGKTINISVPTTVAELSDSSDYATVASLAAVATSGSYTDLSNKPTIGTANLTIQKNGTTVSTFGANATSGVTANITVPTTVSELTDASDYATVASLSTVATTGDYDDLTDKPTIPSVIDDLTSTSTTNALSANQGKALKDMIDDLQALGKFLSLWDCSTGQPISFPQATPYTYSTGDYYLVETVDSTTNYRPNGSSYTGTASTTVETEEVEVGDLYIYDGSVWLLQLNHGKSVSFANLTGQPSDNAALNAELNTKTFYLSGTSGATALAEAQAAYDWYAAGKNPILIYDNKAYTLFLKVSDSSLNFYSDTNESDGNSSTTIQHNKIYLKLSNGVVTSISVTYSTNSSFLKANYNYSTPYTPQYNGSPTTKKYVDDKVSDTAYASTWDGVTTIAPSKNAVYDKISAMDTTISGKADSSSLATVATSGSYNDLSDKPTIPEAQIQSDWTQSDNTKKDYIKNKPSLATVATTGAYSDLSGTPTLATVATSGSYNDLSNKPTIPTVNNATLTIQKNGTTVKTFTANASSDVTANISVPTKTSDITNDSGYITKSVNNLDNYTLSSALATVATTGSYTDLSNKPTIPTDTSDLTNGAGFITGITSGDVTTALGYTPYNSTNPNGYVTSSIINDTAYASSWNSDTTHAPTKNAVYDKIYTMDNTISGKMPGFSLNISHAVAGNPREVKFVTIDYGTMTQYGAAYFRLSAASCHPDGGGYNYMVDIYIGCTYQGVVKCNIIKYVQSSVDQYNPGYEGGGKYFGDVFYVVDTDAKKVYFYILGGQYTSSDFTPAVKIGSTSLSKVTQHSGTGTYYDTGTKVWANGCGSLVAIKSDIPSKTSQLTNDSGFITDSYHDSSKQDTLVSGTNIKTINNTSLLGSGNITIESEGDVTGPSSATDGHLAVFDGATGKLIKDGGAVPSTSDCVKTSGNQTIAGTKTFSTSPVVPSKSTAAGNNATTIATEAQVYKKQDTLVSGTNIKTINNESILGSGNIVIQGGGTEYNAGEGIEIGGDYSAMRGPAPRGFHVPLNSEWQAVYNIWTNLGGGSSDGTNFGIALKLPFAGYRNQSSSNTGSQGSNGYYQSSNTYNYSNTNYLKISSSSITVGAISRSNGMSIRPFKDIPVVPTSSWTKLYGTSIEAGGIFWSSADGLISISSNGTTWITIADKNLGATTVWNSGATLSEANCGKYYQWGNNYGFPRTGTLTDTSTTQVDASAYGPGNYYSSSTFIKQGGNWDSPNNDNLRGGVTGVVTNAITNTGVLSVNGETGDISIQGLPSGGTVGQVLQMTANGPAWVTLS